MRRSSAYYPPAVVSDSVVAVYGIRVLLFWEMSISTCQAVRNESLDMLTGCRLSHRDTSSRLWLPSEQRTHRFSRMIALHIIGARRLHRQNTAESVWVHRLDPVRSMPHVAFGPDPAPPPAGQRDDSDCFTPGLCANFPARLQPVQARHAQIHENHLWSNDSASTRLDDRRLPCTLRDPPAAPQCQ